MSEFRIFCIMLFVGIGLGAAAQNHGLWHPPADMDAAGAILMSAFAIAAGAVAFFGRRSA